MTNGLRKRIRDNIEGEITCQREIGSFSPDYLLALLDLYCEDHYLVYRACRLLFQPRPTTHQAQSDGARKSTERHIERAERRHDAA